MSNCGCNEKSDRSDVDYQYAAKLICGRHKDHLAPGDYRTCINIHNPSRCDSTEFRWKVALARPISKGEGSISNFQTLKLAPDEALQIDCSNAAKLVGADAPMEGWIVVESPSPLDVVAVYTAAAEEGKGIQVFQTERVPCRLVDRCPDLLCELSTGAAAWTLLDGNWPTMGKPDATDAEGWAEMLPDALWIHDPAIQKVEGGISEFKYCFHVCSGFEDPKFTDAGLELLADTHAKVAINGVPLIGQFYNPSGGHDWHTNPMSDNAQQPVTLQLPPGTLRAGENCFTVKVYNAVRSTGMCLKGWLSLAKGMCPGYPPPMLPCPGVEYKVFTRNFFSPSNHQGDWSDPARNGGEAMASGTIHRWIKGINIQLLNALPGTSIEYQMVIDEWIASGQLAVGPVTNGTNLLPPGNNTINKRMEKYQVRLLNAPIHCCVQYSAFVDMIGNHNDKWKPDPDTKASTNIWGSEAGQNNKRLRKIRVSIVNC
jgi:hypothetical protein